MKIKYYIKKGINGFLSPLGYRITHKQNQITLSDVLERQIKRNILINTVIDVGASNGQWTDIVTHYFPDAFYYLIEANPYHMDSLQVYKTKHKNVDFILAAAADQMGEISFDGKDPLGGLAYYSSHREGDLRAPMTTVDIEVATKQLKPPFLLKLDTHCF